MEYGAGALFFVGFLIGLFFRVKALLPAAVFVILGSVGLCLYFDSSFWRAVVTVVADQAALQTGYFVGLIVRAAFDHSGRGRLIL